MELSVPVTKLCKYPELKHVIEQFERQQVTFGLLLYPGSRSRFTIWRAPVKGDTRPPSCHCGEYAGSVIKDDHPPLDRFYKLWVSGKVVPNEPGNTPKIEDVLTQSEKGRLRGIYQLISTEIIADEED